MRARALTWAIFLAFAASCAKEDPDPEKAFWSWFVRSESKFRSSDQQRETLVDQAYERLKKINQGLAIEIGGDAQHLPMELVITAEGKKDLFPLVEKMVAQAPKVEGWQIHALMPARGFEFSHEYDGKELDPKKLWFQARQPKDAPGMLGLIVFIPGYAEADKTNTVNALFKIIDWAIGERLAAEMIWYIDVARLPADPEKDGYVKLVELPQFIEAYKKKHSPKD